MTYSRELSKRLSNSFMHAELNTHMSKPQVQLQASQKLQGRRPWALATSVAVPEDTGPGPEVLHVWIKFNEHESACWKLTGQVTGQV